MSASASGSQHPELRAPRFARHRPWPADATGKGRKALLKVAKSRATLGNVPRPVTDIRAGVARRRYKQQVGGAEPPGPVEANADDLCNLAVERIAGSRCPDMSRRPVDAGSPTVRRQLALAVLMSGAGGG
jgi:hypothetical protein